MIIGKEKLKQTYPDFDDEQFQPNGVDLRLKAVERIINSGEEVGIINGQKQFPQTEQIKPKNGTYQLKKGETYLINLGKLHIPAGTIGLFYLRSTFMRMGCIHTSSVADMGYDGTIINQITNPITDMKIKENERTVQMVLYEAEHDTLYDGDYQHDKILKRGKMKQ